MAMPPLIALCCLKCGVNFVDSGKSGVVFTGDVHGVGHRQDGVRFGGLLGSSHSSGAEQHALCRPCFDAVVWNVLEAP